MGFDADLQSQVCLEIGLFCRASQSRMWCVVVLSFTPPWAIRLLGCRRPGVQLRKLILVWHLRRLWLWCFDRALVYASEKQPSYVQFTWRAAQSLSDCSGHLFCVGTSAKSPSFGCDELQCFSRTDLGSMF